MPMPSNHDDDSDQAQEVDMICIPNRTKYNSKLADMISMVLLFIAPLVVISILYFQIGVALWKSSNGRMPSATTSADSSSSSCRDCESTVTNTASNTHHNSLSFTSSNSRHHRSPSSFLNRLNCLKNKKDCSSRRQRRTCGSFYGTDKLIYKTVNPGNTTMNGSHNGISIPQGDLLRRNTNGLHISCNETSLQPITPSCTVHSTITNGCLCPSLNNGDHAPHSPSPSAILTSSSSSSKFSGLRCCGCRKIIQNSNGGSDSVPVSPYLKRDSSSNVNLNSPPPLVPLLSTGQTNASSASSSAPPVTINSTDPIVLVKFEKNKCHKKCKKNKCTVLIRSAMPTAGVSSNSCDEGIGGCGPRSGEKVELSNLSSNPYLNGGSSGGGGGGGIRLDCGSSSIGSTCTLTASSAGTLLSSEGGSCYCGCSSCSVGPGAAVASVGGGPPGGGGGELSSIIAYCQLCQKKADGKKGLNSSDSHSGFTGSGGALSAPGHLPGGILSNSLERRCDKNLDCISHFTPKDSISTPNSHHHHHHHLLHNPPTTTTTSFGNNQHHGILSNTSCLTHHHCYHHHHHLGNSCGGGGASSSPAHHNNHNNTLLSTTTYSSNFKPCTTTTTTTTTAKGPKRMRVIRSSKYGTTALQRRRRIIRMLIVIVFAFAVCHLPFHARKIWQYWGVGYNGGSVFSQLFTPITFLIMYAQSGINPILYAFMSLKFRNSFADLLCCNMRRSLKVSRNFSVRSTNAIQLSQTT